MDVTEGDKNMDAVTKSDYLWGVPAIAAELGLSQKAVYNILEKWPGTLPVKKVAGKWVGSRTKFREFITGTFV